MPNTLPCGMRKVLKSVNISNNMMRECSKAAAFMNAQAVMASAIMFGHGDVVTMSVNDSAIVLTLVYDTAWYCEGGELEWLMDRVVCGASHKTVDDPEMKTFSIFVFWEFDPNLK